MKGILLLGIFLGGFYFTALHIVSLQLKDIENFYSNMDQVSTSIAQGQTPQTNLQPDKIKAVIDAYTNIF